MTAERPLAVITDTDDIDPAPAIELLSAGGYEVRHLDTRDRDAIIAGARDASALLAGYAEIDAGVIDAIPGLRIIALLSMGTDTVDVEHATSRGVWVSNVSGAATVEVAEHALALALDAVRGVSAFDRSVRAGEWSLDAARMPKTARELRCAAIGYGRIGRAYVDAASAVFGEVRVHDPFVTRLAEEHARRGVRLLALDAALDGADLVSLHLPLSAQTRHLLDERRIGLLRRGAVVVNVSRGELIDEAALVRALDDGRLHGAGLDVLIDEPPAPGHPLLGRDDVVVTPHAGFLSARTLREYPRLQAENVVTLDRSGTPLSPVNRVS